MRQIESPLSSVRFGGASLEDILADPITALLWRSDGITPEEGRAIVRELRETVARGRRHRTGPTVRRPGSAGLPGLAEERPRA
jgi:hypothetical protein